ncbi:hypothetical protein ROHU_013062 [Labeo rohita]|uniref:Reverse transcriptase domain-containing protein n=1 Tax=Labeo rohita TaxID=84645 RepID=A0A498LEP0_LABRO|nr:hypothetical protein ROHU_013062 [Labeo rohita]
MLLRSQGPSSHGIKTMRQEMLESLTRRFAKVEEVKCAVLACHLDPRDPTSKYKKQVIKCLQLLEKQGVIDRKLYYRLYPGDTTPCLYGLPKGDETMVSYDVISLFTCVPTVLAVETVRSRLSHDPMLRQRTQLNPDQKHGCAMGSPVSPIVANLYMEEVEKKALETYSGTLPTHWFRYVDDTWVKIKINEIGPFTDHINSVDDYIKFTKEEMREKQLPFLDCGMYLENEGDLQVEVYRKPTHTDQYLMFDSHHPLEHKLGYLLHHEDSTALSVFGFICQDHLKRVHPCHGAFKKREQARASVIDMACVLDPRFKLNFMEEADSIKRQLEQQLMQHTADEGNNRSTLRQTKTVASNTTPVI